MQMFIKSNEDTCLHLKCGTIEKMIWQMPSRSLQRLFVSVFTHLNTCWWSQSDRYVCVSFRKLLLSTQKMIYFFPDLRGVKYVFLMLQISIKLFASSAILKQIFIQHLILLNLKKILRASFSCPKIHLNRQCNTYTAIYSVFCKQTRPAILKSPILQNFASKTIDSNICET